MNKKTTRIIAIVIAVLLLLGLFGPLAYMFAFSAPVYESQVETSADDELSQKREELTAIEKRLEAAENLRDEYLSDYGKRFRVMCEKGILSYKDIIFSAVEISDLTDRIVIAREISEYDKNMMSAIKNVCAEIKSEKEKTEKLILDSESSAAELDIEFDGE